MSHVKPLAVATALVLSLTSMHAFAATPRTFIASIRPAVQATYFVVDPGTPWAHKVYYFKQLDRDHNGQLSRAELPTDMRDLRLHFVSADWDGNGMISPAEYVMFRDHTGPQYAGVYRAVVFMYD